MAFVQEPPRVPTSIGRIDVMLSSPDPLGPGQPEAEYIVRVNYNTGESRILRGNLVPELSPAQINALLSFMSDMRAKAVAEILP